MSNLEKIETLLDKCHYQGDPVLFLEKECSIVAEMFGVSLPESYVYYQKRVGFGCWASGLTVGSPCLSLEPEDEHVRLSIISDFEMFRYYKSTYLKWVPTSLELFACGDDGSRFAWDTATRDKSSGEMQIFMVIEDDKKLVLMGNCFPDFMEKMVDPDLGDESYFWDCAVRHQFSSLPLERNRCRRVLT